MPTKAKREAILSRPRTPVEKMLASFGRRRVSMGLWKRSQQTNIDHKALLLGGIKENIHHTILYRINDSNKEIVSAVKGHLKMLCEMYKDNKEIVRKIKEISGKINVKYVRNVKFMHYLEKCRLIVVKDILDLHNRGVNVNEIANIVSRLLEDKVESQFIGKQSRLSIEEISSTKLPPKLDSALEKTIDSINEKYVKDVINAPAGRKFKYLMRSGFRDIEEVINKEFAEMKYPKRKRR